MFVPEVRSGATLSRHANGMRFRRRLAGKPSDRQRNDEGQRPASYRSRQQSAALMGPAPPVSLSHRLYQVPINSAKRFGMKPNVKSPRVDAGPRAERRTKRLIRHYTQQVCQKARVVARRRQQPAYAVCHDLCETSALKSQDGHVARHRLHGRIAEGLPRAQHNGNVARCEDIWDVVTVPQEPDRCSHTQSFGQFSAGFEVRARAGEDELSPRLFLKNLGNHTDQDVEPLFGRETRR